MACVEQAPFANIPLLGVSAITLPDRKSKIPPLSARVFQQSERQSRLSNKAYTAIGKEYAASGHCRLVVGIPVVYGGEDVKTIRHHSRLREEERSILETSLNSRLYSSLRLVLTSSLTCPLRQVEKIMGIIRQAGLHRDSGK